MNDGASSPELFEASHLERSQPEQWVAQVVVDIALPHLDRLFDYLVPDKLLDQAEPGVKVRVRFAGKLRDGWLISLQQRPVESQLLPLHAVVSTEPLLSARQFTLLRLVADHYAGTLSDVLRLAIPPRHAATEKAAMRPWPEPERLDQVRVLSHFDGGSSFLQALADGRSPRAAWLAPAVFGGLGDLTSGVVEAVDAAVSSGRGALVVVPTQRELDATFTRFQEVFGKTSVAQLSNELGRSARYRNYLAIVRGAARIVVGTRSSIFAPVHDLGLIVVVDDGNDSHAELRAPYPHTREVAVLRTVEQGCGLLMASHARSAEVQSFIERGWMGQLRLSPAETRRLCAPVRVAGDDPAREATAARLRLPTAAFTFLRDRLPAGPVLIQVPRAGRAAAVQCDRCRNRALCPKCSGSMRIPHHDQLQCSFCGFAPPRWSCPHCHGVTLRAPIVGATRTAEELARAFPGTLAINSSADRIRPEVGQASALVVSTPGAEPWPEAGYSGVLLLDTELMLGRSDLRVSEESLRRWMHAISLCRSADEGGAVLAVGDPAHPVLQALVRGDVPGFMTRELALRAEAGLPPAARVVRVRGEPSAVADFLDNDPFDGIDVVGPTQIPVGEEYESVALLRTPLSQGRQLAASVKRAASVRSARKEGGKLYIHTDPNVME